MGAGPTNQAGGVRSGPHNRIQGPNQMSQQGGIQKNASPEGSFQHTELPDPSCVFLLPPRQSPTAWCLGLWYLSCLVSPGACGAQRCPSLCVIVSRQALLLQGSRVAGPLQGEVVSISPGHLRSGSTASQTCTSKAGPGADHLCVPSMPSSGPG